MQLTGRGPDLACARWREQGKGWGKAGRQKGPMAGLPQVFPAFCLQKSPTHPRPPADPLAHPFVQIEPGLPWQSLACPSLN